jgi:transposase
VITMEDWVTIKNLKRRKPKLGSREIAKQLGISRNTVKAALSREQHNGYVREEKINPDIAPFEPYILDSILNKRLRTSRILEDIKSKGYQGSQAALYRYIKKHITSVAPGQRTYQRYETAPGEQMQYDWSDYTIMLGDTLVGVHVHSTLLGHSRYRVYSASLNVKQGDVFEALEEAFRECGGVCERIQVDNAKVFIDNAGNQNFKWNSHFLNFCGFFGVTPTRSAPYHAWSKGKVENPFDYLEAHFIKGNTFRSFSDFLERLKGFQNKVNDRVHDTTGEKPGVLYEIEKESLMLLPVDYKTGEVKRYVGIHEAFRSVTADCLISYGGNRYSVPWPYHRSQVWVRTSKGIRLLVFSQKNRLIATHDLCLDKGKIIMDKEHYKGYRAGSDRNSFDYSAQQMRDRFSDQYDNLDHFLQSVKAQKRINPAYNLSRILNLFEHYDDSDCIQTMGQCFEYNSYSAVFVEGYITHNANRKPQQMSLLKIREYQLDISQSQVTRDLKEYGHEELSKN